MADTTTELEVLDQIVDVLGGQSGQYETVVPTLQQILALLGGGGGGGGGYNPSLSVGRADALTGADETSQWATRESTGSGAATVRSVQGAAVGWNQLVKKPVYSQTASWNLTVENVDDEYLIINANNDTGESKYLAIVQGRDGIGDMRNGHTYYISTGQDEIPFYINLAGANTIARGSRIVTLQVDGSNTAQMILAFYNNVTVTDLKVTPQVFDLTAMFGAGNEPTTVAEFEAMYPEAYYPYSAPTLKPVQIAGIRSTDAQGGELDSVEWTAQTLWGAGAIGDMLYTDHKETKIGLIDLGTLNWHAANTSVEGSYRMRSEMIPTIIDIPSSGLLANLRCVKYDTITGSAVYTNHKGISLSSGQQLAVFDPDYNQEDSAAAFKAAMSGVMCAYELATPTTTPISPALPMTYKVQQGGSESIIVPDGEVSAAPVLTIAEGESAADVVMDALACIATPDGPVATSSHAVNTYLTMQGKLYKVTSAIAVGETIKSGTNVSQTTVMAELIARTA